MSANILRIWLIISSNDPIISLYLKEKFNKYESDNDINIQLEIVSWERIWTALVEAFKNDTAPDIVQLGTSWLRTFAYMGYLDIVPEGLSRKPSINKDISALCNYKGSQYAVPWIVDTIIMAARKDYMIEYGISKSDVKDWQGFRQSCKKIMKQNGDNSKLPKALSMALKVERDTIQRFFSILWSKGWDFPDFEKVPARLLRDPLIIENMKFLADLKISSSGPGDYKKHPYQINEEFYKHGKSVFYIGSWYGIVKQINTKKDQAHNYDNYCLLPFPSSIKKSCSYGGGTVLAVSARSKLKEEAWSLVEYLRSDDFLSKWTYYTGNVPAYDQEFWQKRFGDHKIRCMYEQTINSKIYPPHPAWLAIENQIIKGIGFTILDLVKKRTTEIDKNSQNYLKKRDENIKNILKISQELRYNE